jgi:hypothetical protein
LSTFPVKAIRAMHERLQEAVDTLDRVAGDLAVYVPKVAEAELSEMRIDMPPELRAQLLGAISRSIKAANEVARALAQRAE